MSLTVRHRVSVAIAAYGVAALASFIAGRSLGASYLLPNAMGFLGPLLSFIPPIVFYPFWVLGCNVIAILLLLLCTIARGWVAVVAWLVFAVSWVLIGGLLFTALVV